MKVGGLIERFDTLVKLFHELVQLALVGHHFINGCRDAFLRHVGLDISVAIPQEEQASADPGCPFVSLFKGVGFAYGEDQITRESADIDHALIGEIGLRAIDGAFEGRPIADEVNLTGRVHNPLVYGDYLFSRHPNRLCDHLARISMMTLSVTRVS